MAGLLMASTTQVTPVTVFGALCAWSYARSRGITHGTGANVAAWADQSGNANNAAQGTDASRPTLTSDGLDFDGSNDHLSTPDAASLDATTKLTIGYRVKLDTVGSDQGINHKGTVATACWMIQHVGSNQKTWWREGAGLGRYGQSPVLSASTWYSMIWVYDGTQTGNSNRLKLYQDGTLQTLTYGGTIPSSLGTDSNPMLVGQLEGGIQRMNGQLRAIFGARAAADAVAVARLTRYLDLS